MLLVFFSVKVIEVKKLDLYSVVPLDRLLIGIYKLKMKVTDHSAELFDLY